MSTHMKGFQSLFFLGILIHFVLAKLATSSIRVKGCSKHDCTVKGYDANVRNPHADPEICDPKVICDLGYCIACFPDYFFIAKKKHLYFHCCDICIKELT